MPSKGVVMTDNTHTKQSPDADELMRYVSELADKNGMTRRRAREALQRIGEPATPYLTEAMGSQDINVRWEAAKALVRIKDPRAARTLVHALMDESFEIQWLAAEALIALGRSALGPLLEGLMHNYGSVYMRQGAHHVLHDLERRHQLEPASIQVLDELRGIEPLEPYPISARRALQELRGRGDSFQASVGR
jgi:HEAT repeat protein